MIELRDVHMAYVGKAVFSGLSLRFESPGAYALLGPSGCGKTTLLRLIAGLETPQRGEIVRPERLSFCFQEDRLLPWYSVAQNVALALSREEQRDRLRALRVAGEWLARVGLQGEAQAYPDALSGGMKRRAALARALAFDAPVLLLDEPFRALDEQTHAQMLALVRERAKGRLLLLVTHDARDAEGMTSVTLG